MVDPVDFFKKKQPWSQYKDGILDYYLKPYLSKVARLGKPVAVVDCFAGAGKFQDGSLGSPRIIAKHLTGLHARGLPVRGMFMESNDVLFERLRENLAGIPAPVVAYKGDFREHIGEISAIAATHTVFVYVDPISPKDLRFDDLKAVYDKLRQGQSVETLINFLSTGFVRRAQGLRARASPDGVFLPDHSEVVACNDIAGGTYWQLPVFDGTLKQRQRIDKVADGYANHLHKWFEFVLTYAIREKYEHVQPKYHLIFGSRHPDAVDLMNRAMVNARREFVEKRFVHGMLYANQPPDEVVDPLEIEQLIFDTLRRLGKRSWRLLRVHATIANPCKYKDSELNQAIKQAIKSGKIGNSSLGKKIEEDAEVWPKDAE